jgi:hypothetical protein
MLSNKPLLRSDHDHTTFYTAMLIFVRRTHPGKWQKLQARAKVRAQELWQRTSVLSTALKGQKEKRNEILFFKVIAKMHQYSSISMTLFSPYDH